MTLQREEQRKTTERKKIVYVSEIGLDIQQACELQKWTIPCCKIVLICGLRRWQCSRPGWNMAELQLFSNIKCESEHFQRYLVFLSSPTWLMCFLGIHWLALLDHYRCIELACLFFRSFCSFYTILNLRLTLDFSQLFTSLKSFKKLFQIYEIVAGTNVSRYSYKFMRYEWRNFLVCNLRCNLCFAYLSYTVDFYIQGN